MDARRKEIEQIQAEIQRLEARIAQECADIGRRLAEGGDLASPPDELRKYLANIAGLRRSSASFREQIRRVGEIVHRKDLLRREAGEEEKRMRRLQSEREAKFEEIGAAAYAKFRALTDSVQYRDLFAPLIDLDGQIRRYEEELRAVEAKEKEAGLLEKLIRHKGRKVILRGSISKVEKAKLKAYFETGRRVSESEFSRLLDADAAPAVGYAEERRREGDLLAARAAERAAELERLEAELRDLGAAADDKARVKEVEKRIEETERELQVMYSWAGQYFAEKDLRADPSRPEIDSKVTLIGGIHKTIAEKKRRIDVLKAELEIDELLKKEKHLRTRRKGLEEEMRVKERQAAVIDIEVNLGLRRIEELKRVLNEGAPFHEAEPLPPTPDFYKDPAPPEGQ